MSDFNNLEVSPVSYFLGTLTCKKKYDIQKHNETLLQRFLFLIYSTLIFLTKDVALWLVFFLLSLPFILKDRFACHAVS